MSKNSSACLVPLPPVRPPNAVRRQKVVRRQAVAVVTANAVVIEVIMGKVIWHGSTQLAPVPAVLVGTGGNGFANNLITVAWVGIVCSDPAMLSISVRPERFSYKALVETGEFTVNIPLASQAAVVDWCGVKSGRDVDKFAEQNLTAAVGSQIQAPLVMECPLNLECKVKEIIKLGSHDMFLAEIVAVQVSEDFLTKSGRLALERNGGILGYAHGHYFNLGKEVGHFGFSVRKKGKFKRPQKSAKA